MKHEPMVRTVTLLLMAALLAPAPAQAQTPRDQVIAFLRADRPAPPAQLPAKAPEATVAPKTVAPAPALPPVTPQPPIVGPTEEKIPDLVPFYVTAEFYRDARKPLHQTQLILVYDVTQTDLSDGTTSEPQSVRLTVGPDYVAFGDGQSQRIFDFRFKRLLAVQETENGPVFDNSSLFAKAYQNVQTVKAMTENGKKASVQIAPSRFLDVFWLEAGLGWTARSVPDDLKVLTEDAGTTLTYDSTTPLFLSSSGPAFPTDNHIRSLFAFWHHELPIHPGIFTRMGRLSNAPDAITILSRNPQYPDGLKMNWTLTHTETKSAPFPLAPDIPNRSRTKEATPLGFVIASAASGAGPQQASPDQLRQSLHEARADDKTLEAWYAGRTLAERLGGCDKDPSLLCEDLKTLQQDAAPNSDLRAVIRGLKHAGDSKSRESGLKALLPYLDKAPAFVLRDAGRARGRLSPDTIQDSAVKDLSAEDLLLRAMAADPYDPGTVQALAQLYAAEGRFDEAWDLQDTLRLLPRTQAKQAEPIEKVERYLMTYARGFFGG